MVHFNSFTLLLDHTDKQSNSNVFFLLSNLVHYLIIHLFLNSNSTSIILLSHSSH
uniref:Uncharacterized protein n=1 Tax=Octopus bimaculoides TaxID=37653 RepID=A0A0L8I3I3_OCTBM